MTFGTRTSAQKFAQNLHFPYVCVQNTWKLMIFLTCTKTVFILFCLFGHLHNFLYLEINQDQITKKKMKYGT